MSNEKLEQFTLNNQVLAVSFVETIKVKNGVICDVYKFVDDDTKDLAIVTVDARCKTPLQRVLLGEKTIEGFYSGAGTLTIADENNTEKSYPFTQGDTGSIEVHIGQTMQWHANSKDELVFYEVCQPAYADGRFDNIADLD